MGLIDNETLLSNAQAVTVDANSTNYYDCIAIGDLARGNDLAVEIFVNVAADFTTEDETYTFNVVVDDNDSFSSPTTLIGRTIPAAQLTAGSVHAIEIPASFEKYKVLRLAYDVGGTTPSITVTASIKPAHLVDTSRYSVASGFTV